MTEQAPMPGVLLKPDDVDTVCRAAGLAADQDGVTWRGPGDDPYVAALVESGRLEVVEVAVGNCTTEIYPGAAAIVLYALISPPAPVVSRPDGGDRDD